MTSYKDLRWTKTKTSDSILYHSFPITFAGEGEIFFEFTMTYNFE